MINIGSKSAVNEVIQFDPNLNEGHICYFKIAQTPHTVEEGNQRSISLLCTGGGNYTNNIDGISYASLCVHRGNIRCSYDTVTNAAYIDYYYRINNGVVEIWISPKQQYPDTISIIVMRNSFNNWTVGQLETSFDLPAGLVDF